MSRIMVALLLLTFAVCGLALTARAQQEPTPTPESQPRSGQAAPGPDCPPDRILVKLRAGSDPVAVIARYGGTIIQTIPGIEVQVVTVPAGSGQQAIDALNADPEVQYAEPDGQVRALGAGDRC